MVLEVYKLFKLGIIYVTHINRLRRGKLLYKLIYYK